MSLTNKHGAEGNASRKKSKSSQFSKWFSWAGVIASVLLFAYIFWRAEVVYGGARSAIYFKYYLISLFFLGFWLFVLRLKQLWRINIVTTFISLVMAIYLSEGILQLSSYFKVNPKSKIEVLDDFIASGIDAVPAVRPRDVLGVNSSLLPLSGVANITTVGENESGKWAVYKSDRYGLNNPDFEWSASSVDWLLTGDSFTEGVAVQPGEDIAGQIRKLTQEHVINLGRSGNGPLTELAGIVEYAPIIEPKKVLWIYYEFNDLGGDLHREKTSEILMKYLDNNFSQNLVDRQPEVNKLIRKYLPQAQAQAQAQVLAQSQKWYWTRLVGIRSLIKFDSFDANAAVNIDPLFSNILFKAKSIVEKWDGRLYFVYLPDFSRYIDPDIDHQQYLEKSKVFDVVNGLNIPIVDIHQKVFSKHEDPISLFVDRKNNHYNAKGYALVAKEIATSVKEYEKINK